jgi:hypothetical protein
LGGIEQLAEPRFGVLNRPVRHRLFWLTSDQTSLKAAGGCASSTA